MGFFFERTETENEIVVVYKPYFLYVFFLAFLVSALANQLPDSATFKSVAGLIWLSALALFFFRFVAMRKTWGEMREAMRTGAVSVSGSKLSPSNPLTYRIPKARGTRQDA